MHGAEAAAAGGCCQLTLTLHTEAVADAATAQLFPFNAPRNAEVCSYAWQTLTMRTCFDVAGIWEGASRRVGCHGQTAHIAASFSLGFSKSESSTLQLGSGSKFSLPMIVLANGNVLAAASICWYWC